MCVWVCVCVRARVRACMCTHECVLTSDPIAGRQAAWPGNLSGQPGEAASAGREMDGQGPVGPAQHVG